MAVDDQNRLLFCNVAGITNNLPGKKLNIYLLLLLLISCSYSLYRYTNSMLILLVNSDIYKYLCG